MNRPPEKHGRELALAMAVKELGCWATLLVDLGSLDHSIEPESVKAVAWGLTDTFEKLNTLIETGTEGRP